MFRGERERLQGSDYCPRHERERPAGLCHHPSLLSRHSAASNNKLDDLQTDLQSVGPETELLGGLFITQTSVSVMTSPLAQQPQSSLGSRLGSRCSVKYEAEEVCGDCSRMCQKSHTERVVVALLLGALIIIFLTLVLSLVYLRETSQQQQYSRTVQYSTAVQGPVDTEQRLLQWAAANNVKIKPGSSSVSGGLAELQGRLQSSHIFIGIIF